MLQFVICEEQLSLLGGLCHSMSKHKKSCVTQAEHNVYARYVHTHLFLQECLVLQKTALVVLVLKLQSMWELLLVPVENLQQWMKKVVKVAGVEMH
jgi:hypothetical protein